MTLNAETVTGEPWKLRANLPAGSAAEAVRIYASLGGNPEQREQRKLIEFIESRGGTVTVRDAMQSYWPFEEQAGKKQKPTLNRVW